MEIKEKIHQLFRTIDQMDSDKFVTFLTEDAEFRFGNSPSVFGKKNIRDAVDAFFKSIKALKHENINLWQIDNHVIYEGKITYTRLDSNIVHIPFLNTFGMVGDLIKDYYIYIDITPLYATIN